MDTLSRMRVQQKLLSEYVDELVFMIIKLGSILDAYPNKARMKIVKEFIEVYDLIDDGKMNSEELDLLVTSSNRKLAKLENKIKFKDEFTRKKLQDKKIISLMQDMKISAMGLYRSCKELSCKLDNEEIFDDYLEELETKFDYDFHEKFDELLKVKKNKVSKVEKNLAVSVKNRSKIVNPEDKDEIEKNVLIDFKENMGQKKNKVAIFKIVTGVILGLTGYLLNRFFLPNVAVESYNNFLMLFNLCMGIGGLMIFEAPFTFLFGKIIGARFLNYARTVVGGIAIILGIILSVMNYEIVGVTILFSGITAIIEFLILFIAYKIAFNRIRAFY